MNRVVHFEIHASDANNDKMAQFYRDVFGWEITDKMEQMGNYRIVKTGENDPNAQWPGINGGMTPRHGDAPKGGEPVNAFVCTISVEDIDATLRKILDAGGTEALAKMDVPGVGLLAYMKDPDGNIFGVLQPHKQ